MNNTWVIQFEDGTFLNIDNASGYAYKTNELHLAMILSDYWLSYYQGFLKRYIGPNAKSPMPNCGMAYKIRRLTLAEE